METGPTDLAQGDFIDQTAQCGDSSKGSVTDDCQTRLGEGEEFWRWPRSDFIVHMSHSNLVNTQMLSFEWGLRFCCSNKLSVDG